MFVVPRERKEKRMDKSELRHYAEDMIDELREMPDGAEITSAQLLSRCGVDLDTFSNEDLLTYHEYLLRAAKYNRIRLDMSKRDGKMEGLPYNLDFVVHNRKAQIKCPHCGSTNTARMLYGMREMSDLLREKIGTGKVRLGGCCVRSFSDGELPGILAEAERYCNDCRKKFAFPPYLIDKNEGTAEAFEDIVKKFTFRSCCYLGVDTEIEIWKNDRGAFVHANQWISGKIIKDRHITELRWRRLINDLYTRVYLNEWKKNYSNQGFVLPDGEAWDIEVKLTGRRVRTYGGYDAYPPYWPELKALLRPFLRAAKNVCIL